MPSAPEAAADCPHCGDDLATLPADGACPECGAPAADARRPNLLRGVDPGWLKRLRRGAASLMRGIWVTLGGCALAGGVALLGLLPGVGEPIETAVRVAGLFTLVVVLVGLGEVMLGQWALAAPEPAVPARGSTGLWRRIARLSVIVTAGLLLTAVPLSFVHLAPTARGGSLVHFVWLGAVGAALALGLTGAAKCAAGVAARSSDAGLARRLRIATRTLFVVTGIAVVGAAAALIVAVAAPPAPPMNPARSVSFLLTVTFGCIGGGLLLWLGAPRLALALGRLRTVLQAV